MKRFNGKPMAHWEAMAKKLVVDSLVRASLGLDGSGASLPGKMASERLMAIALAEDASLVREVLGERDRFQAGMAKVLSAVTAWKPQRKKAGPPMQGPRARLSRTRPKPKFEGGFGGDGEP